MIHVNASAECIDIFHFKFHTDFGCAFQEFPAWQDDGGHLLIIASAECIDIFHFKFHTDFGCAFQEFPAWQDDGGL
jgi:hypothetical protein